MSIPRCPKILIIKNGKLVQKQKGEIVFSRVIPYFHTVRPSPDQYYSKQIRGYREQIAKLSENYRCLEEQYRILKQMGQNDRNIALKNQFLGFSHEKGQFLSNQRYNDIYLNREMTSGGQLGDESNWKEQMRPRMVPNHNQAQISIQRQIQDAFEQIDKLKKSLQGFYVQNIAQGQNFCPNSTNQDKQNKISP